MPRAEMRAENGGRRQCCCFEEYLRSSGRDTQAGSPTAQCHRGVPLPLSGGDFGSCLPEVILQR